MWVAYKEHFVNTHVIPECPIEKSDLV